MGCGGVGVGRLPRGSPSCTWLFGIRAEYNSAVPGAGERLPRAGWQPAVPGLGGWWLMVLGTWGLFDDLVIVAVPGDKIGDALFDRGAGREAHFAGEVADVGDGGGDVAGLHGQ